MEIDRNAPAFGPEAQIFKPEAPEEQAAAQPEEVQGSDVDTEEPARVKYSRYEKKHREALEAHREAEYWRERAQSLNTESSKPSSSDLPDYWTKLYGDSDASKEAWQIQRNANEELKREAREEALEVIRNERFEEASRTEANLEVLDDSFDELSDVVGRDLTSKEQSALLDIIDDYTPKDRDGNYAGPIIPFDKAWKIYQMENQSSKEASIQSRNSVASLSNTRSQGEPTLTDKDANFNGQDWGAWRKRI